MESKRPVEILFSLLLWRHMVVKGGEENEKERIYSD